MTKENILTDRDLAANVTIYLICWENQQVNSEYTLQLELSVQ